MSPTPPPIIASNPFTFIGQFFADYTRRSDCTWPFDFLVGVAGRGDSPGPRDDMWEYTLDAGRNKLQRVLDHQSIGAGPHYFVFPDRWLVPGEAQGFVHSLCKNPDAAKFGRVYVITHQPYIVGDCMAENVRILRK